MNREIFNDGQEDCYLKVFISEPGNDLAIEAHNDNGYDVGCYLNIKDLEEILAELKKVE